MQIFDYDNILLLPRKCLVESRSQCDSSVQLGAHRFKIPAVPANMKTVVDENVCQWLAENGARGEFVLVVASAEISGLALESEPPATENSPADLEQLLLNYLAQGLDKKQAIAQIAKKLNIPKKVVYNKFINKEN